MRKILEKFRFFLFTFQILLKFFFFFPGVCLVLLLSGHNAIETVFNFFDRNNQFDSESVFIGNNENQVEELTEIVFDSSISGSQKN